MASVLSPGHSGPGRGCREGRAGPGVPRLRSLHPGCWMPPAPNLPWLLCCRSPQPGPGAPRSQGHPARGDPSYQGCVWEGVQQEGIRFSGEDPSLWR